MHYGSITPFKGMAVSPQTLILQGLEGFFVTVLTELQEKEHIGTQYFLLGWALHIALRFITSFICMAVSPQTLILQGLEGFFVTVLTELQEKEHIGTQYFLLGWALHIALRFITSFICMAVSPQTLILQGFSPLFMPRLTGLQEK